MRVFSPCVCVEGVSAEVEERLSVGRSVVRSVGQVIGTSARPGRPAINAKQGCEGGVRGGGGRCTRNLA